ncbi:hypothetical protein COP2_044658 [Malus domestica]
MGLKRLLDIFMGLVGNGCDEAGAGSSPSPQQKRLQPENLVSLNHEFTCKGSSSTPLTVKGWKELTMEEKMEIANGLKQRPEDNCRNGRSPKETSFSTDSLPSVSQSLYRLSMTAAPVTVFLAE